MKKRILSILLTLCMVLCLVPVSVLADDTVLQSVAVRSIGPNEAEVANDLYEKMSAQVSVIKLINDIELSGSLPVYYAVTIDLNGHVLKMGDIADGSVIKIESHGDLTITDSNPTAEHKFTPNADGLWVLDETGGTEIVKGGVIYGGTGTEMYYSTYGGGVLIESGGQFTMNGGAIIGCVAGSGGGVETDGGVVGEYGTFTMNGGVIDSCVATGSAGGGGVRSDGLFIMGKDATIKNCKAVQYGQRNFGSGIVLAGDDRQTVDGTIIAEDAVDGKYIFVNRSTVAIGENANIHANITLDGGKIDLGGSSATIYGKITNDSYGGAGCFADGLVTVTYKVNNEDYATQILRSGSTATRPAAPTVPAGRTFDGWYKADGTKWDFNTAVTEDTTLAGWLYVPVTNETELTAALQDNTAGMIRLTQDIALDGNTGIKVTENRKVILDLNGYVLDLAGKYISVSATSIAEGGTNIYPNQLTIMDSNPDAEHKFAPNTDGLWVLNASGDKLVKGGVITGGAMIVGLSGMVIMNGGNIVGCSADGSGGGVNVTSNGTFEMNAGSIAGCKAIWSGGGVIVRDGCTFIMNGGNITDCVLDSSVSEGGAVWAGGTFTMTGGSIEGCTATNGSALCLYGTMNANGGTVSGTVVLEVKRSGDKGIIQGNGSTATQFNGDVTNNGEIKRGTFSGTVTLGNSNQVGTITGGTFNGPVTTDSEGEAEISGGVFNKTVTINRGEITKGTFNKDVVVYNALGSFRCTTLTGGTYNGMIINKSAYAAFFGAHSPLGIVGEKPYYNPGTYCKVTFDPAGGEIDYPVRYFFEDGNISNQIVPDSRAGYFFAGWYNGENKWNYSDTVGENDLTLTAHWIACDHSGHTGAQPTCTTSVICTECGGTISALGHNFSVQQHNNNEHWNKCSRCDATDGKEPHDWNSGTVTKPASCIVSGEKTYTCIDCGFEKIESIDAKGHNYGEEWQHDGAHHWHRCSNCDAKDSYIAHSGGTATCTEKANCEVCGESYGDLDPMNHSDGTEQWTTKDAASHEKKWTCCGAVTVASEPHEWADGVCSECEYTCLHTDEDNDHICDLCGKVITDHTGGKATCKDKAVCKVCGKTYGETNANNHSDLRHIDANSATNDAEGNIEYWYCDGCDKYFADAAATKEIAQADTVTAKLPKSPKTCDNSTPLQLIALLFINGGVLTSSTICGKKKKCLTK